MEKTSYSRTEISNDVLMPKAEQQNNMYMEREVWVDWLRLSKIIEKYDTFNETIITHSSAVTVAQHLWAGIHEPRTSWLPRRSKRVPYR